MNTPMIIGRQTFDGLGRHLSVEVGGHSTRYHYTEGLLPPSANTLADGKRVEFTYEQSLSNLLLSVAPEGEPAQFLGYNPLGMPASASGALGTQTYNFTASGHPSTDTWMVDGASHVSRWHHSLNGLLQGFVDAQGVEHRRTVDAQGRVTEVRAGNLISRYRYDALSRLTHIDVENADNSPTLSTALTYDNMGREHTRTLVATTQNSESEEVTRTLKQSLRYSAFDQITSRYWDDGERDGEETFAYDHRKRLVYYTADSDIAPNDPFGNPIVEQHFSYNAFNGHEQVMTRFADGSSNETSFTYAETDPTRLISVTHTHPAWPSEVRLTYDACGRVISDSLGRSMSWNAQGRLTKVTQQHRACEYAYTASGHLTDRVLDGVLKRSFFSGLDLTHEQTGDDSQQFCSGEQGMFAINTVTDGIRQTTLLGADAQGSVRLEANTAVRTRGYSAYGAEAENAEHTPIGFAGQRTEPLTGWQILGDYRPYDPVLMCFLSPDSESPFGRGGINPYVYCAGDPINRIDPDGHSWVNYALAGVGLAIGAVALVASYGALSTLSSSIAYAGWSALTPSAGMILGAAALDVISLATGAAALKLEMSGADEHTASILGWISLGTGLAGGLLSGLAGPVARFAGRSTLPRSRTVRRSRHGHVLFEEAPHKHDVVFHEQLWGTRNLKGFETHGTPEGYLLNAQGIFEPAANVAKREIAPRLANYEQHRPLVLLACEGGSSGAAQEVANVLRRPVIGFDEVIYIGSPSKLGSFSHRSTRSGIDTSLPLQKLPFFKRFRRGSRPEYAGGPNFELATSRIYQPE